MSRQICKINNGPTSCSPGEPRQEEHSDLALFASFQLIFNPIKAVPVYCLRIFLAKEQSPALPDRTGTFSAKTIRRRQISILSSGCLPQIRVHPFLHLRGYPVGIYQPVHPRIGQLYGLYRVQVSLPDCAVLFIPIRINSDKQSLFL